MTTYVVILTILTALGLLGCLTFIAGYWWVTQGSWIREEPGRFLMTNTSSVAGLLLILLLNQWLNDVSLWMDALRRPITMLVSITFVASLWWPLRLLWLAQREKAQAKTRAQEEEKAKVE